MSADRHGGDYDKSDGNQRQGQTAVADEPLPMKLMNSTVDAVSHKFSPALVTGFKILGYVQVAVINLIIYQKF